MSKNKVVDMDKFKIKHRKNKKVDIVDDDDNGDVVSSKTAQASRPNTITSTDTSTDTSTPKMKPKDIAETEDSDYTRGMQLAVRDIKRHKDAFLDAMTRYKKEYVRGATKAKQNGRSSIFMEKQQHFEDDMMEAANDLFKVLQKNNTTEYGYEKYTGDEILEKHRIGVARDWDMKADLNDQTLSSGDIFSAMQEMEDARELYKVKLENQAQALEYHRTQAIEMPKDPNINPNQVTVSMHNMRLNSGDPRFNSGDPRFNSDDPRFNSGDPRFGDDDETEEMELYSHLIGDDSQETHDIIHHFMKKNTVPLGWK
jgi:hypothetical protein